MLGRAAFAPPCADSGNVGFVAYLLGAIGSGRQFDESVKRNVHPGALGLVLLHKVSIDATQNSLVRDNEDVLASLELHNDRLETNDHITV